MLVGSVVAIRKLFQMKNKDRVIIADLPEYIHHKTALFIFRGKKNGSYDVLPGQRYYIIPRHGFSLYSEMMIYVKAVNELGETKSAPVVLEPLSVTKFEPPEILKLYPAKYGCLRIEWKLSELHSWMENNIFEVHVKASDGVEWRDLHVSRRD